MIYISHLLEDEEMREVVAQTGAGVESIEFSVSDNLDSLEDKISTYQKRMKMMGAERLTLHGPFLDMNPMSYDSWIREVTMERFTQAYEAGIRLGAEKIVYHTCFLPTVYYLTDWAKRTAEFWNEFMEGKKGMQVLLENVYDPEPDAIVEVKELVESQDFKLCLDLGHAHCYSLLPLKIWIESFGKHTGQIHVHDNCKGRDLHLGVGKGNIPYPEVLHEIREQTGEVDYTIECSTLEDVMHSCQVLQRDSIQTREA